MKNNGVTLKSLILTLQQYLSHHLRAVSEHLRVRDFILPALLKATILHSRDAPGAAQTEEKECGNWPSERPWCSQLVSPLSILNFFSAKQG